MYRVYLRYPDQAVGEKTATGDLQAAVDAFAALVNRTDLDGQRVSVIFNRDSRLIARHNFQSGPGYPMDWWRGRIDQLPVFPSPTAEGRWIIVHLPPAALETAAHLGAGDIGAGILAALEKCR